MTERRFDTIEEMVSFAEQGHNQSRRWMLESWKTQEFVDPEAGNSWNNRIVAVEYVSYGDPAREGYNEKMRAIQAEKPAEIQVTLWYLKEAGYSRNRIALDSKIGEALYEVWTKKPSRFYGKEECVGSVTLKPLLKRLGYSDMGERIRQAQKAAEESREALLRERTLREAGELARQLLFLMGSNPNIAFPNQLTELAKLGKEK